MLNKIVSKYSLLTQNEIGYTILHQHIIIMLLR